MHNISGPLALLDELEGEVEEALAVLTVAQAKLKKCTETGLALALLFDSSLARLSLATELDSDWQTVKEMVPRLRARFEMAATAIREAVQS